MPTPQQHPGASASHEALGRNATGGNEAAPASEPENKPESRDRVSEAAGRPAVQGTLQDAAFQLRYARDSAAVEGSAMDLDEFVSDEDGRETLYGQGWQLRVDLGLLDPNTAP